MADSLPSIRFSNIGSKQYGKPRPSVVSLSLPAISTRGLTTIASSAGLTCSTDTAPKAQTQGGRESKGARKRLSRVSRNWWEPVNEDHASKKGGPRFVPEPLAVRVFRKTERQDDPRFLPPLIAASGNNPKVPAAHELQLLQTIPRPAQKDYSSYLSVMRCGNLKQATIRRPQRREAHVTIAAAMSLSPPHVPPKAQAPFPLVSLPSTSRRPNRSWLDANVVSKRQTGCEGTNIAGLTVIHIDGSLIGDSNRRRSYSTVVLPQLTAASVVERLKRRRASDSVCVTRPRRAGGLAPLHTVDVGAFFGSLPLWLQRVRNTLRGDAGDGGHVNARHAAGHARKLMAAMRGTLSCGDRVLSVEEQSDFRKVEEMFATLVSKLTIIDLNAQYMADIARPPTARRFRTEQFPRRPRGPVRNGDGEKTKLVDTRGDAVMERVDETRRHFAAMEGKDTDNMKKNTYGGISDGGISDGGISDGGECDDNNDGGECDGCAGIDDGGDGEMSKQAGDPLSCTTSESTAPNHTSNNNTSTDHMSTNHTSTNHTSIKHTSTDHTSPSHLLAEYKMSVLDERLRKKGLKVYTMEESRSILESVQRDLTKLNVNDAAAAVSSTAEVVMKRRGSISSVAKETKRRRRVHKIPPQLLEGKEDEGTVEVEEVDEGVVEMEEDDGTVEVEVDEEGGDRGDTEDGTLARSTPDFHHTETVASKPPRPTKNGAKSESPVATDTAPLSPVRTTSAPASPLWGRPPRATTSRDAAALIDRTSTTRRQTSRSNMVKSYSRSKMLARHTSLTNVLSDTKENHPLKRQRHVLTPAESPEEEETDLLKEISNVKAMVRGVREIVGGVPSSNAPPHPPNTSNADPKQITLQVQGETGEEAMQLTIEEKRRKAIEKELEENLQQEREEVVKRRQQKAQERERANMAEREAKQKLTLQRAQEEMRDAAERERRNAILQRLRNELELKHTLQTYIAETLASYDRDVQAWEEADYAYIEYCLGAERCGEVKRLEEERRVEEKRSLDDQLNRALEYRKQELLLRLQEAQQQFYDSVQREKAALEKVLKLSPAFVFSYFEASAQPRVELGP